MPIKFREIFNAKWFENHSRLRPNGTFEIRCTLNKIHITGSGKDLDSAAINFIYSLTKSNKKNIHSSENKSNKNKHIIFCDFAEKWLEIIKKPTVKEITFISTLNVYNAHIKKYFKKLYLDELTAMQIQPLFTKLTENGKTRTAQNVKIILNQIFKAAIAERIITLNPMDNVKVLKHHCINGTALTYTEENIFINKLKQSKYKLTFAFMLFCGMRRAELKSVKIEGNFIIVTNGKKRLSDPVSFRKIPITPMLEPFIAHASGNEIKIALSYSCDVLSRAFKALCPEHHLHELRHTFISRCQECGVAREIVSAWAGHAADSSLTSKVYTHFSDEFMFSEGQKVNYSDRLTNLTQN